MKMAMVRTPLRVSFVGGGSDLPGGEGAVVSSTISLHVYCIAKLRTDGRFFVNWSQKEVCESVDDVRHDIVRECLKELGYGGSGGVELSFLADVPGRGSGLGSSAATCVSCLHALALLRGFSRDEVTAEWLARTACQIQMRELNKKQGSQDEYACAYGGLRIYKFKEFQPPQVERISLCPHRWRELSLHFSLYASRDEEGRNSEEILSDYTITDEWRLAMVDLADQFAGMIRHDNASWVAVGRKIFQHHLKKCELTPMYKPEIRENDMVGIDWKLCGAGRTGHLLVATSPRNSKAIDEAATRAWGPRVDCAFVQYGSRLVYSE